jgi:putative ABC transport system permease protein
MDEVRIDVRILAFTLAISILAGLLFGLLPAWRFAQADPQDAMKTGSRNTTAGRATGHLRLLLVGLEVGLSTVCLIAGGLLLRSFVNLLHVNGGFAPERIITVDLNPPKNRYPDQDKKAAFLKSLIDHVAPLPGVASVGISNKLPLSGEGENNLLSLEGQHLPLMERPLADIRKVNPDYFKTMGIPLRSGRIFTEADRSREIALVSGLTAQHLWPGQRPIGKRFRIGGDDSPLLEVVGIIGDIRGVSLSKPATLTVYTPYWYRFFRQASLAVKTSMDLPTASSELRRAIYQVDPELPVSTFRTMEEIVSDSVAQRRFQMDLILLFAIIATLLASLGIYGVISYSVAQRTGEVGIRMALGAQAGNILGLILGNALLPVAIGLAAGVTASLALGRLLTSLLFGVAAEDLMTIAAVVAVLGIVAVIASYIPAHRATRIDPLTALRYE